eukprot:TRINITY_DN23446_c0_g1_i3.p1 TRINITY_DN23446_c0_g1~~TRINITY_DN23446_c0_g1_i3.p1  ORF type:complete len:277 (-),score=44.21 TRINITY_DN23446_c0_g1_i3:147-977(-)
MEGSAAGNERLLAADFDTYGGVMVDAKSLPSNAAAFRTKLGSSLREWSSLGKHGVWLKLPVENAALIPIATSEFGFEFHHAEKAYLMLTKWLPTDKPDTLPLNASHTCGVGAVVTDKTNRVLLVREKSGPAARLGIWKVPTGLVDAGEDLHAAVVREVMEETGVEATFDHVGGFIMNHGGNPAHPGKSNLFFSCKLTAVSDTLSTENSEIAEARWFTQEEWQALQFPDKDSVWHALNRSVFDDSYSRILTKRLPWGPHRPNDSRQFYYPSSAKSYL